MAEMKKNTALNNYRLWMVDSAARPAGLAGLTVSVSIAQDGGTYTSATNSASELALGEYKINFTAAEMNGDIVSIVANGAGADQWRDQLRPPYYTSDDLNTNAANISIAVDSIDAKLVPMVGAGTIRVDHDYPTTDNLKIVDAEGTAVNNADVWLYIKSNYDAGLDSQQYIVGWTSSDVNGEWRWPVWLDAETYTVVADGPGLSQPFVKEVTVS